MKTDLEDMETIEALRKLIKEERMEKSALERRVLAALAGLEEMLTRKRLEHDIESVTTLQEVVKFLTFKKN